ARGPQAPKGGARGTRTPIRGSRGASGPQSPVSLSPSAPSVSLGRGRQPMKVASYPEEPLQRHSHWLGSLASAGPVAGEGGQGEGDDARARDRDQAAA